MVRPSRHAAADANDLSFRSLLRPGLFVFGLLGVALGLAGAGGVYVATGKPDFSLIAVALFSLFMSVADLIFRINRRRRASANQATASRLLGDVEFYRSVLAQVREIEFEGTSLERKAANRRQAELFDRLSIDPKYRRILRELADRPATKSDGPADLAAALESGAAAEAPDRAKPGKRSRPS